MKTCTPRFIIKTCLCLLFSLATIMLSGGPLYAADHLDGEQASADPAADITDVYAWMQNANTINLIVNLFPLANSSSRFSDSVQYAIRVQSQSGYSQVTDDSRILCSFTADQKVSCSLEGRPLVSEVDASGTGGTASADGSFRIFTGLRNDPFFFDLDNFKKVRSAVVAAAPSLNFDEAGCPTLNAETQSVLVSSLTGNGGIPGVNKPAKNFFESLNVMSIVIQADKSLFGPGPLYAVSASTHRDS